MIHGKNGIVSSLTVRIVVGMNPPSWLNFIDFRSEVSVLSSTYDHTEQCICHEQAEEDVADAQVRNLLSIAGPVRIVYITVGFLLFFAELLYPSSSYPPPTP